LGKAARQPFAGHVCQPLAKGWQSGQPKAGERLPQTNQLVGLYFG